MLREIIFALLCVVFAYLNLYGYRKKDFRSPVAKIIAAVMLSLIFLSEAAYFILFALDFRLPVEAFANFAAVCAVANSLFALILGDRRLKAAYIAAAVAAAGLSLYFVFTTSQGDVTVDGGEYVGEYPSSTGVTDTVVKCYEKRNAVFTRRECAYLLNYGIVLTEKPDFDMPPYSIERTAD